jgi:hypothetical protein
MVLQWRSLTCLKRVRAWRSTGSTRTEIDGVVAAPTPAPGQVGVSERHVESEG